MLVFFALLIVLGSLAYYYLTYNYDYWKKRGVTGPEPKLLVGNLPSTYNRKVHIVGELTEIYKTYKGKESVVGLFRGVCPELLILDPEIARNLSTTNFKNFANQGNVFGTIDKESDPLAGRNPFFLKGEEWKEKRSEIIPAFSSGRMKALFPVMEAVADKMKSYIENQMETSEYIETRELCGKYTTDVVCNSIYGVDSGALSGQQSELRDIARNVFSPTWRFYVTAVLGPALPFITKILKFRFVPEKYEKFLTNLLKETISYRKENNIERQDFVDYLIHLREKKGLDDVEVMAHTITFFFDGVETSSITLSHVFYELAKNKQFQQKLRDMMNEIKKNDGTFEYDAVMHHEYLEQVIVETLRLHPVIPRLTRECSEDFDLELADGKKLHIEKGTNVGWPMIDFQQDPEYYGPTAKDFDPDRFNEENGGMKQFKDKGVLFPFGDGPRVCLGQRFAQTQMKCCIAHIITSFEISVSEKMPKNPVLNPADITLTYHGGILLKFKPIKN